jgi:hypothetical protein
MSALNENDCLEWIKTLFKDTAINKAFTTYGTNANKITLALSEFLCKLENRNKYLQDALNLVLQDDFEDPDKVAIFETVLAQKEQDFDLYNSKVFTVPSDLQGRLELLQLVEASARGKIQSISDCRKILSFLGVNQVEFYFQLDINSMYDIGSSYRLAHWGKTTYEDTNTWKILLPESLEGDTERRLRVEEFLTSQKQPQHDIEFIYNLNG